MSAGKRSATSELNHDNWNDEAEPEDAGTFAQADEATLKGRVIKTAKRRGLQTSDGAPSVFAGFGGFKATQASGVSASFDFLSKPSSGAAVATGFNFAPGATTAAPGNFTFGNANKNAGGTPEKAGFSFIPKLMPNGNETKSENESKKEENGATTSLDGSINKNNLFVFGKASSSNGTSTSLFGSSEKSENSTGTFGGSANNAPFAVKSGPKAVSFGVSDEIKGNLNDSTKSNGKTEDVNDQSTSNTLTPLNQLAAFKSNAGDKWTCSTCMVSNDAEKSACVCCETAKPGGVVKRKWTCDTCMVSNDADKDACVCCEAAKPGSTPKKTKSATTSNAFGSIAPGGGFKFGGASEANSTTATSGFTFGAPSTHSNQPQSGTGFTFATDSTKATNSISGAFKFGNTSTTENTPKESNTTEKVGTPPQQLGTSCTSNDDIKKIASNSQDFLSHLSALNKQFLAWIQQHVEKNPYVLLAPCLRDYEKHLNQLTKEHGQTNSHAKTEDDKATKGATRGGFTSTETKAPTNKGLLAGVFGPPSSTSSAKPFSFGANETASGNSAPGGFVFGNSTPGNFTFAGSATGSTLGSGSMFGQAAAAAMHAKKHESDNAAAADGADDNEDQPPKVEITQVVEQDSIHSVRCKLYYKKGKEFTEKGLGMLHLKKVDSEEGASAKTQLLVRAETNLGNILLNILLNKQMSMIKRNNCVQFVCIPNPEIPGIEAGSPVTMLVKVKDADLASILEDEVKKEIDNM